MGARGCAEMACGGLSCDGQLFGLDDPLVLTWPRG